MPCSFVNNKYKYQLSVGETSIYAPKNLSKKCWGQNMEDKL